MTNRRRGTLVALSLLTALHCTLAQMTLSVTLGFSLGESTRVFMVHVGLYLAAMGGAVILVELRPTARGGWLGLALLVSVFAGILANPGIPLLMLTHARGGTSLSLWAVGTALTLGLGGSAGAILPLASKAVEHSGWPIRTFLSVLAGDYLGAFLGALLFALLAFPRLGLLHTVVLAQVMVFTGIVVAMVSLGVLRARPARTLFWILLLSTWSVASLILRPGFLRMLDGIPG